MSFRTVSQYRYSINEMAFNKIISNVCSVDHGINSFLMALKRFVQQREHTYRIDELDMSHRPA